MRLPCGHEIVEHVAVHEAGHLVLAISRGIDFRALALLSRAEINAKWAARETFMPGFVTPHRDDVSEWFQRGPDAAIDFLAAGAFAEGQILGEAVPGGMKGDIDRFKAGMGVKAFSIAEAAAWVQPATRRLRSDWPMLRPKVERVSALIEARIRTVSGNAAFEIARGEILDVINPESGDGLNV